MAEQSPATRILLTGSIERAERIAEDLRALLAAAPAAPPSASAARIATDDMLSHHGAWRTALVVARGHGLVEPPDIDDRAYWAHELEVFDRTFAAIPARIAALEKALAECVNVDDLAAVVIARVRARSLLSTKEGE